MKNSEEMSVDGLSVFVRRASCMRVYRDNEEEHTKTEGGRKQIYNINHTGQWNFQ